MFTQRDWRDDSKSEKSTVLLTIKCLKKDKRDSRATSWRSVDVDNDKEGGKTNDLMYFPDEGISFNIDIVVSLPE